MSNDSNNNISRMIVAGILTSLLGICLVLIACINISIGYHESIIFLSYFVMSFGVMMLIVGILEKVFS